MSNTFGSTKAVISTICDLEKVCNHWGKSKKYSLPMDQNGKIPSPILSRWETLLGHVRADRASRCLDTKN